MRCLLVLVLAASPAAAEVELEAELTAGASTTDGRAAPSNQLHLAAGLVRWEPPERRASCDHTCKWCYASLDPEDRDGIGLELDGELLGDASRAIGRAWAAFHGWSLERRVAYQAPAAFTDRFPRTNRGVREDVWTSVIPGPINFSGYGVRVAYARSELVFADRRRGDQLIGSDFLFAIHGASLQTERLVVDALVVELAEYRLLGERIPGAQLGTEILAIDLDVLAVDYRLARDVSLVARAGVSRTMPRAQYAEVDGGPSHHAVGPMTTTPTYWAGVRTATALAGAGRWVRLDPTGHAVDVGHLASATFEHHGARHTAHGELHVGHLRRDLTGYHAPRELPAPGRRVMGRAALSLGLRATRQLAVVATGWVEHSDRDDVRWKPDGLRTHAGADLHLSWSLSAAR